MSQNSRLKKWQETDCEEMYLFIAVTMLISRNKKLKITECWSKDPLLRTDIFQKVMCRDRYLLLLRMLHFCNNDGQQPGDRLYKIENIMTPLKSIFQKSGTES